jgi:hypothetical protein
VLLCALAGPRVVAAEPPSPALADFFESEIRPLLAARCFACHSATKTKGSLRLDTRAALLEGGARGPAAVSGKPEESLLIQAIRRNGDLKMPPKARLTDAEIDKLVRWVKLGLPWPEVDPAKAIAGNRWQITSEQRRFWSFQPVKAVPPPTVHMQTWPRSDIDRFILAALEARGLRPAPPADRRTLLRRATFDLTGLPPTPAEMDAFLADASPGAFARVVDRLLASPHYGERWGRHWLDIVRYADCIDARFLGGVPDITEAYRYRDWVVDAFNRDLPYDRFLVNQIAGDLLRPPPGEEINAAGIIATSMLAIGRWEQGEADKEKMVTDIVDDQIDVVCRTFLGLTVACARCHDHKFDPISTDDYYGLAGIFFSSHVTPDPGAKTGDSLRLRIPLVSSSELNRRGQYLARIAEVERQIKQIRDQQAAAQAKRRLPQTARYLMAAWEYQNRRQAETNLSLAAFAAERHLNAGMVRQCINYLGLGDGRLLLEPVRDLLGHAGVHSFRGGPDTPWLSVNTNDQPVTIGSYTLPPRSVAVHPSPAAGVAVGWRSPITGTVRITGRVVDADPACGDGIAWVVQQRRGRTPVDLASGDISNGGAQALREGKAADRLTSVPVHVGEVLALVVLPKRDHACDSTVIELEIAECGGQGRIWNLTREVVPDLLADGKGNPHGDGLGNREVWHFYDLTDDPQHRAEAAPGSALARWFAATEKGVVAEREIRQRAHEVEQALLSADVLRGPNAGLYRDLISPRSPFWTDVPEREVESPDVHTQLARLSQELETLKQKPALRMPTAHGVQEGGCPQTVHAGIHDARIHIRGRYDRLGQTVPRHFPRILAGEHQSPITQGSGRLQLAQWIADPKNPLTARVLVNRVWQHHFGEGLVRTPGNFGKLGQPPTHPELLDFLADRFVCSGWSIKQLHRTLMLSAVYQQASVPTAETCKADPDNRLFGRMNRRRLEAEEIRDSLLAVSGRLDRSLGGPASRDFDSNRRTLYFITIRSDRSSFRDLFDAADPTAIVEKRTLSTVAPQALFLMNHPFVRAQSQALAKHLVQEPGPDRLKIERAYVLLYGRLPTEAEMAIGSKLLAANPANWSSYCQVLLCANEFVMVD